MKNSSPSKNRYPLLDILRGISVIGMIVFHANYLLEYVFSHDILPIGDMVWDIIGFSVAVAFITLAGLISNIAAHERGYSRIIIKSLKRTLILSTVALSISLGTYMYIPEQAISWGIIHFLALASLIGVMTLRLGGYINILLGVAFLMFPHITLPDWQSLWLVPLGFPQSGYMSADYYPLIPWFGYYLLGQAVATLSIRYDVLRYLSYIPQYDIGLSYIGRHALLIYILHVPILYVMMWVWIE